MSATESSAKKLAGALDRCAKHVHGLSDQALNAAAAASFALRQESGTGYPADYVRKKVSVVLIELEDIGKSAGEVAHDDEPRSVTSRIISILRRESAKRPVALGRTLENSVRAYCAARGSSTEWRRPSGPSGPSGAMPSAPPQK